jgi:transcriptional regulator with XRE-family HTH domain
MANVVDVHIGTRVRMTREFRNVSQKALALALGITETGLRSRELGKQRFTSVCLLAASRFLKVKPPFFFEGLHYTLLAASANALLDNPQMACANDNVYSSPGKGHARRVARSHTDKRGPNIVSIGRPQGWPST